MLNLEELTKEQLIKICKNQQREIRDLQEKNQTNEKKLEVYSTCTNKDLGISRRLEICMQETLSYIEDVEYLKEELRKKNL